MPNPKLKEVRVPGTQTPGSTHTVEASFEQDAPEVYTVTATAGPGGSIDPTGTAEYPVGQDAVYTVAANIGFHIAAILVDGVAIDLNA